MRDRTCRYCYTCGISPCRDHVDDEVHCYEAVDGGDYYGAERPGVAERIKRDTETLCKCAV